MSDFYYDDEREDLNADGIHGDEEDYGSCPVCGGHGEMVDVGRRHWLVCHRDRVKWRIGSGVFGLFWGGRGEKWNRAGDWLREYREVQADKSSAPPADEEAERFKRMFE